MWLLQNDSKGNLYRITPGKLHIVTRKDGDLVLQGDQSISRKHAALQVDEDDETTGVTLKDLGSKYGTFTATGGGELVQLPANQQVKIKNGDRVRFGMQWNTWRLELLHLLVATSTLNQEEKSEVKHTVESLGGKLASDWRRECTHLTMNKLTVTVKVVCALAAGQPIVTPAYWTSFAQAVSTMQGKPPDCKDFVPPLAEATLDGSEVSFKPNPARSKLFQGYTFVAASARQLGRIKPMITAAGGRVNEFSSRTWTEERLTEDKTVLMLSSANEKNGSQHSQVFDGYNPMARKLRESGVRCIPESEIGLSVVHCSTQQFCNPRFSAQTLISNSSSAQATQHITIICPETEESGVISQENNNILPNPQVQCRSKKRPLELQHPDQDRIKKKRDLRANSEDFFGSQDLSESKLSVSSRPSSKDSLSLGNRPLQNKSLDMFASSSGQSSSHQSRVVTPSCQDLFASSGSGRLSKEAKDTATSDLSFPQKRTADEQQAVDINLEGDKFSFPSTKKIKNAKQNSNNNNSVNTNKLFNVVAFAEVDDPFSFNSSKISKKRNRQSNLEQSMNNSLACPSNFIDNIDLNTHQEEDNIFAFPDSHKQKKRRINDVLDLNKIGSEVKIAILGTGCSSEPECDQSSASSAENQCLPDEPNLTTYSKIKPTLGTIKKEVDNEEIDELARDFFDATIVVFKPLLVKREIQQSSTAPQTGKNFKKFRKVLGLNKRVTPHIIGGSDLIPHYNINQVVEDETPSRDQHVPVDNNNDDDWSFGVNRNLLSKLTFFH